MWINCVLFLLGIAVVLSSAFPGGPKHLGENGTTTNQRFAVLSSYVASGTKNVRWETMATNAVDDEGKPVQQKNTGVKGSFGCLDMQDKEQKDGAEYERPSGKFKYKCVNGMEEVIACKASRRAGEKWIKVGESLKAKGFWHKCDLHSNMSVIYTQENSCSYNNKEFHAGDEIRIGFLRLECQDNGYKVVGCYYNDENHNQVPLNPGERKETGKTTHMCEDRDGNLQYSNIARGCTKNGKDYEEGQQFKENHLRYICLNFIVQIEGCYIDEKTDLEIGQDVISTASHMIRRCYRDGKQVAYQEYPCGSATTKCRPEIIPSNVDDAPLIPVLKAPGYSTFAVVQQVGGDMVPDPGTLKVDLEKILAAENH